MNENVHTFQLNEGGKRRFNAGSYDPKFQTPKYEIEIFAPDDQAKRKVEISQIIMGPEGANFLVWEIENNSTWPIFFSVKKNGVLVER